ncbi:MAG: diphosphomevalonate decarboxylase [Gammaproteobacteria bacterium]|nr:diphosphomevalonate decarboxylase [Gammaproteobacteria bacterium]NNC76371.1 diphosphomevalonate decarboxylase [Woeseiaceae bacterium]
MHATATAPPNIALIKYWGKRDVARNLPAVGSISVTLADLATKMRVTFDDELAHDVLTVNGDANDSMLPRISRCITAVAGEQRRSARIESQCNFPIAAGLASSASAFAATVIASASASGQTLDKSELANLAGRASGSAARSLFGGFVELTNRGNAVAVETIKAASQWPLEVVIAITETGAKPVSSGDAMELSRKTSPFYECWVLDQDQDLQVARAAINESDFEKLAAISEHNCLKMHSVMWASRPPIVYWNAATIDCLQRIRDLRAKGTEVFFTIDAGPQVKAVCSANAATQVRDALADVDGVVRTMTSGLGDGAKLVEPGCAS